MIFPGSFIIDIDGQFNNNQQESLCVFSIIKITKTVIIIKNNNVLYNWCPVSTEDYYWLAYQHLTLQSAVCAYLTSV